MSKWQAIFILVASFAPTLLFSAHIEYDVIPVISDENYNQDAFPSIAGLTSKGHIAGYSWLYGGFLWSRESGFVPLELPTNPQEVVVLALNEHDQIVGGLNGKAVIWNSDGTIQRQGILPDERYSMFTDINDNGTATGIIRLTGNDLIYQIVIRDADGSVSFIDYPGDLQNIPIINNNRQIAAYFDGQLFTWKESTGWAQLQLPENTEYHQLLEIDDANSITASLMMTDGSSNLPQTYIWETPGNPQKSPVNFTDMNQHGQYLFDYSNLNFFFDGQSLFSFESTPLLSFRYLYSWDETINLPELSTFEHISINDNGQILSQSAHSRKPYLFDPVRISFDDPTLSAAIGLQLGLDTAPNYMDVLEMRVLDANSLQITSLGGLEYAANLQWLDVRGNPLDKRSVCYTLEFLRRRDPNMTILYDPNLYSNCTVEFGDPKVKAAVAETLGVSEPNFFDMHTSKLWVTGGWNISDLSGLENASYLRNIEAPEGTFSDLSPIENLMGLQLLVLERNRNLSDIAALGGMLSLKELYLRDCSIADIRPLLNLSLLTNLGLEGNPIDPMMACEVLPQIRERENSPDCKIYFPIPTHPIHACSSDLGSIRHLSDEWLREDCTEQNWWCNDTDINRDGRVNLVEMSYIAAFWLREEVYW